MTEHDASSPASAGEGAVTVADLEAHGRVRRIVSDRFREWYRATTGMSDNLFTGWSLSDDREHLLFEGYDPEAWHDNDIDVEFPVRLLELDAVAFETEVARLQRERVAREADARQARLLAEAEAEEARLAAQLEQVRVKREQIFREECAARGIDPDASVVKTAQTMAIEHRLDLLRTAGVERLDARTSAAVRMYVLYGDMSGFEPDVCRKLVELEETRG